MNNPIKLTDTLYGVVVINNNLQYKIEVLSENDEFQEETMLIFDTLDFIRLPQGKFEIIGEVTCDWISFNVEKYIQKEYIEIIDTNSLNGCIEGISFKDYNDEENGFESSIESFYSLLQSKEIYFVNPLKQPLNYDLWEKYGDFTQYGKTLSYVCKKWQESESKLVEKVVILNRK